MKFSERWLRELVDIELDHAGLVDALTNAGLEVDSVVSLPAKLDGIVVGRIIKCLPHRASDRLQICEVDIGADDTVTVVCGAHNAREGIAAPLATIGSTIANGERIEAVELRGTKSQGMLCSAAEIGLAGDDLGLMELGDDLAPGTPVVEALALPDHVLELKLTPNRADCFGLAGVARDLSAATGASLRLPSIDPIRPQHERKVDVRLEAGAACPRYCARWLRGVNAKAGSPAWLRQRLLRSGIRPVSAVVDVTQYVMLELGQPLHAFDAAKVLGDVVVRYAAPAEQITLLDGREVKLEADMLVISDDVAPLALAGIMGGAGSKVDAGTTDVLLEAAHFAPAAILGRSRRLGLATDAAHRFERGVNPELPRLAIERATAMILELAGGEAGPVVEACADGGADKPGPIDLRRSRIERVLGIEVPDPEVTRILTALGFKVSDTESGWQVGVPSARFDVSIEEDLIEEIARLHGFDQIPATLPGTAAGTPGPALKSARDRRRAVARSLTARGWFEAVNLAFVDASQAALWGFDGAVDLANPLSADLGRLRPSLLPGLVAALARNHARQQPRAKLFEIGRSFAAAEGSDKDAAPAETERLALAAFGSALPEQWAQARRPIDFADLRGEIEAVIPSAGQLHWQRSRHPAMHPGKSADLLLDEVCVGFAGHLHPALIDRLGLDLGDVVVAELAIDAFAQPPLPALPERSRFPAIRRDLAVDLPVPVSWAEVNRIVRKAVGPKLRNLELFDVYTGPGLDADRRSLAIGLILQDVSSTLVDADGDEAITLALAALVEHAGARARG